MPNWAKKFSAKIPSGVKHDGPQMLLSGSLGAYVGRAFSLRRGITTHAEFFSFWPIFLIVIMGLSVTAWWGRELQKDKDQKTEKEQAAEDRKLLRETHYAITKSTPKMEIESEGNTKWVPADTLTVPAGASVTTAIGVGPLTVVVPGGKMFGSSTPGTFKFTVPEGPQSLKFPLGATITSHVDPSVPILHVGDDN